jgi:hypothetical protein
MVHGIHGVPLELIQSVPTEIVTLSNIQCMTLDTDRGTVWIIDSKELYSIHLYTIDQLIHALCVVPELLAFPPGVVPVCVSYLPLSGVIRMVHEISETCRTFDIGILRRTGDVYIAIGQDGILRYSITTNTVRTVMPQAGVVYNISPTDINGSFMIETPMNKTCSIWDPIENMVRISYKHVAVCSIVCNPLLGLFFVFNRTTLLGGVRKSFSVISEHGCTELYPSSARDGISSFVKDVRGLIGSDTDTPFSILMHPRHICDASIEYGNLLTHERAELTPPSLRWDPMIITDGRYCTNRIIFYSTTSGDAIHYAFMPSIPSTSNCHKRRRVET